MVRRHTSYKLPDDSLEVTIRELTHKLVVKRNLQQEKEELQKKIQSLDERLIQADTELAQQEERVIQLLNRHKKPIIIDCVEYSVVDGRLQKRIIL